MLSLVMDFVVCDPFVEEDAIDKTPSMESCDLIVQQIPSSLALHGLILVYPFDQFNTCLLGHHALLLLSIAFYHTLIII